MRFDSTLVVLWRLMMPQPPPRRGNGGRGGSFGRTYEHTAQGLGGPTKFLWHAIGQGAVQLPPQLQQRVIIRKQTPLQSHLQASNLLRASSKKLSSWRFMLALAR